SDLAVVPSDIPTGSGARTGSRRAGPARPPAARPAHSTETLREARRVTALSSRTARGSRLADSVFRGSTRLFAAAIIVVLVAIAGLLVVSSRLTWQTFGLSFLTGTTWDPVAGVFGALPFVV